MKKARQRINRVKRRLLLASIGCLSACGQYEIVKVADSSQSLMESCRGYARGMEVSFRADGFEMVKCGAYFSEFRNIETGVHYYFYHQSGQVSFAPVYQSDGSIKVAGLEQ